MEEKELTITEQAKEDMLQYNLKSATVYKLLTRAKVEDRFNIEHNGFVYCFRKGEQHDGKLVCILQGVCEKADYEAIKDCKQALEIWFREVE